jgi:hypothetical protein
MAIPSRGIGWGTEENLLWQISKQIERLTQVTGTFGGGGGGGVSSIIAGTGVSVDQSTGNVTVSATSGFNMSLSQIVSAGLKYSVALTGTAPSSTGYVSNLMILSPFIPANDLTISNVSIQVNTGVASALAKILVYADVNGRPNGLLIESVDLDCSTLGTKTYNTVYTFEAGKTYWMGTILNSTQSIRSVTLGNLMTIGTSATASSIYTVLSNNSYLYTDPVPANPTLLILSNGPVPMVMLQ